MRKLKFLDSSKQNQFARRLVCSILIFCFFINLLNIPVFAESSASKEVESKSKPSDEPKSSAGTEEQPETQNSSNSSRIETVQKNNQFNGSKDGLKQLDNLRIKRPTYGDMKDEAFNNRKKDSDQMPPLAPDIVKKVQPKKPPEIKSKKEVNPLSLEKKSDPVEYVAPVQSSKYRIDRPGMTKNVPKSTVKNNEQKTADSVQDKKPEIKLIKQIPKLASPHENPPVTSKASDTEKKAEQNADPKPQTTAGTAGGAPGTGVDQYPTVGRLEKITFGKASPDEEIGARISKLENSIFARSYSTDSLFDRTERLKVTLLGTSNFQNSPGDMVDGLSTPPVENPYAYSDSAINPVDQYAYLDELARNSDNQKEETVANLQAFAEELINFERKKRNLSPLEHDKLIQKMADDQMIEMLEIRHLSHNDSKGLNPDRRYTVIGGVDAVTEGLVSTSTADLNSSKLSRASVCILLKKMFGRQDDRESLLAPEATHLATSFGSVANGTKILGCTEVLTRRALIHPIVKSAELGDKLEVSGIINKPYQFDRITIAWEEFYENTMEENPESDEPLPYFPPLDYLAYSTKSEKDYSKAIGALKALGVVAAIAGGMFVPPVALAAPLIIMAGPGGTGELRPQSDIPVKGGVKLNGTTFKAKIPLDNESQEGIYYITVWASLGEGTRATPISRRAILVKKDLDDEKEASQEKSSQIEYTKEESVNDKDDDKVDKDQKDDTEDDDDQSGI